MQENTDNLIELLRKNIKGDKESKMNAIVGRIPLLCKSVLDIHEMQKETSDNVKSLMVSINNLALSMKDMVNTKDADKKYVAKEGNYALIQLIVFGIVGMIILGFVAVAFGLIHLPVIK